MALFQTKHCNRAYLFACLEFKYLGSFCQVLMLLIVSNFVSNDQVHAIARAAYQCGGKNARASKASWRVIRERGMVKARTGPPKGTGRIPLRDKSAKSGSQGSIAAFSGPFKSENLGGIGGQFSTSARNLCPARLVGRAQSFRTLRRLSGFAICADGSEYTA